MLPRVADPKVAALSRVPLFAGCSQRELEFIAAHTDEVEVTAGRELTTQGARSHTFYVMLDGHADVTVDGEERDPIGPGDFFGEITMLDQGEGTATITTTSDCRLMVMSHSQFRDVVKSNDAILVTVLEAMASRLRTDLEHARSERKAR
jgi:CRP-like cAMP-binding protein